MSIRAVYEDIWDELFSNRAQEFVKKMENTGVQFEEYDQALDEIKAVSRHEKSAKFYLVSETSSGNFVWKNTARIFRTQVATLFEEKETELLKQHNERFERVAYFVRESQNKIDNELAQFRKQMKLTGISESESADREGVIRESMKPVLEKYKKEVFYFTQTLGHVDGLIEKMTDEALRPRINEQERAI